MPDATIVALRSLPSAASQMASSSVEQRPRRRREVVGAPLDLVAMLRCPPAVRRTIERRASHGPAGPAGAAAHASSLQARVACSTRGRHRTRGPVDDQCLDARHAFGGERRDVAVAAVLAQQRDAEPQREVRLVGPLLGEVTGEQRPALGAARRRRCRAAGRRRGRCRACRSRSPNMRRSAASTAASRACHSASGVVRRHTSGTTAWMRDGLEVVEGGDHHLGRHRHPSPRRGNRSSPSFPCRDRARCSAGRPRERSRSSRGTTPAAATGTVRCSARHVSRRSGRRRRAPCRGTRRAGTPTSGSARRCRSCRHRGCAGRARTCGRPRRRPLR